MASMSEITQLCRLCLIKDEVNVPIFQDVNVIDQIFLKISACLPIKVSKEDKLPKKICDACSYKLELFYDFLNTSKASEKQLRKWIDQLGAEKESSKGINPTTIILKQEIQDPAVDLSQDELSISTAAHNYSIQQQQLSYGETVEFELPQEGFININEASTVISSSRKRPAESEHGLSDDSEYDDDVGLVGSKITKMEDDEDSEIDADQTAFIDLPSGSGENDQAGPSGVGKETADAPLVTNYFNTKYDSEDTSKYKCEFCPLKFIALEEYEKHIVTNSCVKSFKMDNENSNSIESTSSHHIWIRSLDTEEFKAEKDVVISAKSTKWFCRRCKLEFRTSTLLKAHRKTHKKEEDVIQYNYRYDKAQKQYVCCTCDFEAPDKTEIEKHVISHEEIFTCSVCDASFLKPYEYCIHVYNHDTTKNFQCPMCQYETNRRTAIGIHIKTFHLRKYTYTCEECGKGFNDRVTYYEHHNVHKGIKPFKCIVCDRDYAFSSYLTQHQIRYHTVLIEGIVGSNQCSVCSKRFSRSTTLQKHMKQHDNAVKKNGIPERKHLCDICGMGFAGVEKLRIHYRVHTGVKPYECSYCSKGFTKRDYLIMHERVHSGEKPYICKHCGKGFSQGAPLRQHLRIHTGERPYNCHLCNNGFISRGVLNTHLKKCPGAAD